MLHEDEVSGFLITFSLFLEEMTSAWLQTLPYKHESGFLAYGSFSPFYYRSLSTTKIVTSSFED